MAINMETDTYLKERKNFYRENTALVNLCDFAYFSFSIIVTRSGQYLLLLLLSFYFYQLALGYP